MKNAYSFLAAMCVFLSATLGRSQDADMTPRQATLNDRAETSEALTAPERPALPAANTEAGAPMPAFPAYGGSNPAAAPCLTEPGHRSCLEQLEGWLTYRPLYRNCCGLKCAPCCEPPLYTFFLGSCCVNSAAAGCRTACGQSGCCGCGHGLAGFWDGGRLRQRLDDFLFYHHEACAQGSCPAGEIVVEKPN